MGTKKNKKPTTTCAVVISRPNPTESRQWAGRGKAIVAMIALDQALENFRKEERVNGSSLANTTSIAVAAAGLKIEIKKAGQMLDYLTVKAMNLKIDRVEKVVEQDKQIIAANKRQAKKQEQRVQHANLIEARKSIKGSNERSDRDYGTSFGALLLQELGWEKTRSGSYGKAHFNSNGKKTTITPVIK